jgi:hypothetical protein
MTTRYSIAREDFGYGGSRKLTKKQLAAQAAEGAVIAAAYHAGQKALNERQLAQAIARNDAPGTEYYRKLIADLAAVRAAALAYAKRSL